MRGIQRGLAVVLLALTVCVALSGAVGAVGDDTLTNTTATPTPTDSSLTDTVDDTTSSTDSTLSDTGDSTDSTLGDAGSTTDSTLGDAGSTTDSTLADAGETTTSSLDGTTDTTLSGDDSTDGPSDDDIVSQIGADTTETLKGAGADATESTKDTGAQLTEGTKTTSSALVEGIDGSLSTTTSLDGADTTDDGNSLAGDDSPFSVSGPAGSDDGTLTFESSESDEELASSISGADQGRTEVASLSAVPRQFPSGPGPMAAGATAVAGLGAIAVGSFLGSGTGIEREVSSRVTGALDRLVRMVAPFRYSSYDGDDPLEHEDRAAINDYVEANPGAYMSAVSDAVEVPHSTARHHIKILEREGVLENAKVRGRRRLFPAHAQQQELAAAMADEATADMLEAIARLGPCSGSALAEEVGKSVSTVSHHLSRLADGDLVVREKDGRATVNKLPSEVQEALAPEPEPAATEPPAVNAD